MQHSRSGIINILFLFFSCELCGRNGLEIRTVNEELLLAPPSAVSHRRHLLVQHVVVCLQLTLHPAGVHVFRVFILCVVDFGFYDNFFLFLN